MGCSHGLSRLEQQYLCNEYQDKVPNEHLSCKSPLGQFSTLQTQTFHGRENVKEVNELYLVHFGDHLSEKDSIGTQ